MEEILSLEVQEPWLEYIDNGTKNTDARVGNLEDYKKYLNKYVLLYSDKRNVWVKITDMFHYKTLNSYLDKEGWYNAAPNVQSKKEATEYYKSIADFKNCKVYSKDNVRISGGIVVLVIRTENSTLKTSSC